MRAIILAAGEGSRLRPFTADKPKPMVRAANKPILQHGIEALVENGVRDITLVVGYHRERVQAYFGDGKKLGAQISYAFQDALTGTARALATAKAPSEPFLVLGGDNVVDAALIKAILGVPRGTPAMVVHRSERPHRYGVVTLDGEQVGQIVEKPSDPRSHWVNTGVYSLTPELHARAAALADTPGVGLPDVIQEAIHSGARVRAVKSEALWSDAVYPWDLLRVHADILHARPPEAPKLRDAHLEPPVLLGADALVGPGTVLGAGTCIGSNVAIGPHCVIENCVLYDDVQIGPGSILRNCVIGAGTRIGPRFTALSGPAEVRLSDGWHHLDDFGAILGDDCRIGGAVTALPGTMVGNRVSVADAKVVSGGVADGSRVV